MIRTVEKDCQLTMGCSFGLYGNPFKHITVVECTSNKIKHWIKYHSWFMTFEFSQVVIKLWLIILKRMIIVLGR